MMHKKIVICGLVLTALSFSSCSEYSLMDDEAIRMGLFGEEYSENFENAYGKIAPDQTWDFSRDNLARLGLVGGPNLPTKAQTRGADTPAGDWNNPAECHGAIPGATAGTGILGSLNSTADYLVDSETLEWLNTYLKEGDDNRSKGTSFKLVKPENNKDFLIIPVYQGHSGMSWDLHLVAKDESDKLYDYKLWSHSDGFKVTKDYTKGVEFYYNTADGNVSGNDYDDVGEWGNDGIVKQILLKRAFPNFETSGGISDEGAQFILEVPAHGYVKGLLTNKDDVSSFDKKDRWNIEANNDTDAPKTFIYNIEGIKSESWFPSDMWNFVFEVEWYNENCCFNTYDEKRVRIFTKYNYSYDETLTSTECGSSTQNYMYRHTVNYETVKTKPMRIDCSKIKDDFYFYLDIVKGDDYVTGGNEQAYTGTRQRSDEGMMLALTGSGLVGSALDSKIAPYIDGSISSCEYFVIGCEDANLSSSDWDINDVVFLVVGLDKAPKIKEIISKRYMIEDLGSTFDFDFNDIVVDVTQETLKKVGETSGTVTQTAEIKTLGGTLPFKVEVGNNTVFDEVNPNNYHSGGTVPQRGSHPSASWAKKEITGWDPLTNKIKITVGTEAKVGATELEDARTIAFPEEGKIPYIIAVDQTVDWSDEEVRIPSNWFNTWPQQYNDRTDRDWGNNNPQQGGETQLWSGTETLNGYEETSNKPTIDASLSAADVIKIEYTLNGESGVIQVFERVGEKWEWKNKKEFNVTTSGSITCTMESSQIIRGIALQGENVTITKVSKVN